MRRHKISDWNIWYGSFGKTDYAKQMGNFVAFRCIFDLLVFLPLKLFMITIYILLYVIVYIIGLSYNSFAERHNKKRTKIDHQKGISERIVASIESLLHKINSEDTNGKRKKDAQ
jgi:hypothetical protein